MTVSVVELDIVEGGLRSLSAFYLKTIDMNTVKQISSVEKYWQCKEEEDPAWNLLR